MKALHSLTFTDNDILFIVGPKEKCSTNCYAESMTDHHQCLNDDGSRTTKFYCECKCRHAPIGKRLYFRRRRNSRNEAGKMACLACATH